DTKERTEQVQLMTDIYCRAQSVAIWLGPGADDNDKALKCLEEVAAENLTNEQLSEVLKIHAKRSKLESELCGLEAVARLFERDYWDRLWVVQEV
ncbi:uncharacterized protein M421DRAFT_44289, partial [Didymella exigua CBS 183.55]